MEENELLHPHTSGYFNCFFVFFLTHDLNHFEAWHYFSRSESDLRRRIEHGAGRKTPTPTTLVLGRTYSHRTLIDLFLQSVCGYKLFVTELE
jgi:hypothetical protein